MPQLIDLSAGDQIGRPYALCRSVSARPVVKKQFNAIALRA